MKELIHLKNYTKNEKESFKLDGHSYGHNHEC